MEPRPPPFPMNTADFFKSLSHMRLQEKHQAQNTYINHLLVQITLDQTEMQLKSSQCTSERQDHNPHLSIGKRSQPEQLAKLYSIIAKLLDELKVEAETSWRHAAVQSFNERMGVLEGLWGEYTDIAEVKWKGVELVRKRAKSHDCAAEAYGTDRDSVAEGAE